MIKQKNKLHKIPVLSWCPKIEKEAQEQINNLASLPFIINHIAIMPDCHKGYGIPIGTIMVTKNVIIPNAIGVDIGCGIQAIKTNINTKNLDTKTIKIIIDIIKKEIPIGVGKYRTNNKYKKEIPTIKYENIICYTEKENITKQLGTLGGGNHFIEFQKDKNNNLWIMVHTGSKNIGHKVASYYNDIAKYLNAQFYSKITQNLNLAFLPINSTEGQKYIKEMNICIKIAKINRNIIIDNIIKILKKSIKEKNIINDILKKEKIKKLKIKNRIDIKHNYAKEENHFNKNVWVHRKGTIMVTKKTLGIIPGSQGTNSYIIKGKENKLSFNSCSHGAGRTMSRKQAQKTLNLKKEQEILNKQNIIHNLKTTNNLEEAPNAYKNIETIINNQKDLITIVEKLSPIATIKE